MNKFTHYNPKRKFSSKSLKWHIDGSKKNQSNGKIWKIEVQFVDKVTPIENIESRVFPVVEIQTRKTQASWQRYKA
jgi:hypothetical protein